MVRLTEKLRERVKVRVNGCEQVSLGARAFVCVYGRKREREKWAQEKILRKPLSRAEHHLNGQVCCVCYGTVAAVAVVDVVDSDDVQLLSQETFALQRCQEKFAALLPNGEEIYLLTRKTPPLYALNL